MKIFIRHNNGSSSMIECDYVDEDEDKSSGIVLIMRAGNEFSTIRNIRYYKLFDGGDNENITNKQIQI